MIASKQPLKHALSLSRAAWDQADVRQEVRTEFQKVLDCRTPALGAEVFASAAGKELLVPHTCKSRACPSCGQRSNQQWLRERAADLPALPYCHVVLTMPDHFWPLFRANRRLLHDLPALGAYVVERWFRVRHDAIPLIIVVPHTFGKDLKFNPHLHLLVSTGGLGRHDQGWRAIKEINAEGLMKMWRYIVVCYLRAAQKKGLLRTAMGRREFALLLEEQYGRRWNVFCQGLRSRWSLLHYAGRYVRRPPIAQHKIREVGPEGVRFTVKDRKRHTDLEYAFPLDEFWERLSHHVPDRYRHSVRYFGLLAPRRKADLYGHLFHLLGQRQAPRPPQVSWALAIRKSFGHNPLLDEDGQPMRWAGRLTPQQVVA